MIKQYSPKKQVLERPTDNLELGRRVGSMEERVPQQQTTQGQKVIQQRGQVVKQGREKKGSMRAMFLFVSLGSLTDQERRGPEASQGWIDAK